MRSNKPLDSYRNHKLVYITIDETGKEPGNVMILPYLHDRKIYLIDQDLCCDYFYTSMRVSMEDIMRF